MDHKHNISEPPHGAGHSGHGQKPENSAAPPRMKKLAVNTLQPGMIFPKPVYIEDNNILVPAGIPLREKDIERLISWKIETVETEDEFQITAEEKEDAAVPARAPAAPSLLSLAGVKGNDRTYRSYISLIEQLGVIFTHISAGIPEDLRAVNTISDQLLQGVREHRDSFISYILGGEVAGHKLAKSPVNTAILSALTAQEMHFPNHKILQTVTGALLHDVGMLRLPKEILNKRGGLSVQETQRVKGHPLYGYRITAKELLCPEEINLIVLQHHERWDGTGYPRRLSGAAIEAGAQIVSVADAFEAMVSQRPYRSSMVGYQAVKNLLSDNSRRFDPDILKIFIKTIGVYPIGSIVRLNNGVVARVIEVNSAAPLRPRIRILIDESGAIFRQDDGAVIDLLAEKSLFIAKTVDPKEFAEKKP